MAVTRAVLHSTHHSNQGVCHVGDAQVDDRAFAHLENFFFNLLFRLRDHFFDACRVDAAVAHKLVKAETGHLSANRVKAAEDNGLWGIVYNELDTCCGFQGSDISPFAANDAAFDVVASNVEHRDAVFDSVFSCDPLDGLNDHLFGFLVGSASRVVQNVLYFLGSHGLGVANDLFLELLRCRFNRHSCSVCEHLCGLSLGFFELFLLGFTGVQSGFEGFLVSIEPLPSVFELLLIPIQVALLVFEFVLEALNFDVARLDFLTVLFFQF